MVNACNHLSKLISSLISSEISSEISSRSPPGSPPKSHGRRFGRRFGRRWEEKGSAGSDPNSKVAEGGRTYTNGNGIILTCCTEGNANGETSTNPQQTRCRG